MSYRQDFPLLMAHPDWHYLDSAATSQRPQVVLDALLRVYQEHNGNAGRGSHRLAVAASEIIREAREAVQLFLHAASSSEIVFTKQATEALNIVAFSYGKTVLKPGDEILLPLSNHHANLVPWQEVAKATGAKLVFLPLTETGEIDLPAFEKRLSARSKILAFSAMVNTSGIVNPVKRMIDLAHAKGAVVVVDAAQSLAHDRVDVQALDADFLVFSGHKIFSAFGVGVLYGKASLLEQMPPFLYGGDMIRFVEKEGASYQDPPQRFEGGTMNVAAIASLQAALAYIDALGYERMHAQVEGVRAEALKAMQALPYVQLYHQGARLQRGIISFNVQGVHAHDTAQVLDSLGVMVRSGHHCTQPHMQALDLPATCRASFAIYNTSEDVAALCRGLAKVAEIFLEDEKEGSAWT